MGEYKMGKKNADTYMCIHIHQFTLFLLPVKASETDTWDESQNSHGTDFNHTLQNQVCFSFLGQCLHVNWSQVTSE